MPPVNLFFIIIYLCAILLGTIITTLTLILSIKKKTSLYVNLKNFSLTFLLYVLFEYLVYYFLDSRAGEMILMSGIHFSNVCYFVFIFCWIKLLMILSQNQKIIKEKKLKIITLVYGVIAEGLSLFVAKYDETTQYFQIEDEAPRLFISCLNLAFGIFVLYLSARYIIFALKSMEGKRERIGILLFGAILFLYTLWIIFWDYNFARGMVVDAGANYTMDPILVVYLAQSFLVIWFFLKKDPLEVGALHKMTEEEPVKAVKEPRKTVKDVCLSFHLTAREIEVAELVYQGMSNPEIGKVLFIAENTVKRHLNNIFKKIEVKNRYELLSFITNNIKTEEMQHEKNY